MSHKSPAFRAPVAPLTVFTTLKRERQIRDARLRQLVEKVTRLYRLDRRGAAVVELLADDYLGDHAKRTGAVDCDEDPAG